MLAYDRRHDREAGRVMHLIEALPDDQVEEVLADARRRTSAKPKSTWPPKFVGMIKDGPADGSTPSIEAAYA